MGEARKCIQNASAYASNAKIRIITNENIWLATKIIMARYLSKNSVVLKKYIVFTCNVKTKNGIHQELSVGKEWLMDKEYLIELKIGKI